MANRKLQHAFRWNAYAQAVAALGQIAITLLLVRLLEPEELGRVALVYLVAGLVSILDEGGFSTKVIARDERREGLLTVVFYQELLVGVFISACIFLLAPLLGVLFSQPDLPAYLYALGPVFAFTGPRRFYQTLFQRDLAFRGMGIVRMLAATTHVVVTVLLAVRGYGVWSLVIGLITRTLLESIGYLFVGLRRFRPGAPHLGRWHTGYGRAGMAKIGERLLAYGIDRLDLIIIGQALGPGALGVYDVFKRLGVGIYQQVIPIFSRLLLPQLARLQDRPKALAQAYVRQLSYICYILFPAYLFQAFFAGPIVALLFGEDWLVYVPIFVWMSVLLMVRGVSGPVDALLMARGYVKRELIYSVGLVGTLCLTLLYAVGGGLEATVVAVTWLHVALTIPIYLWVVRPASYVGRLQYFRALAGPFVLALSATLLTYVISTRWTLPLSGHLMLAVVLLSLVYVVLLIALDASIRRRIGTKWRTQP